MISSKATFGLLALVLLGLPPGLAGPARAQAEHATDLSAYSGEPFVIERLATSYRFEADGTGRTVFAVRVRVQSETGVQQLGQMLFPYVSGRDRLELDFLRVHRPDGSVTDGSPDLLQDLPAPVTSLFPVYSDIRVLHVTVPSFRPGDILEYQLTNRLEAPEAPNRFWMADAFERTAIVLEETIEVDVPAGEWINLYLAEGMDTERHEADGRRIYRWTNVNTEHRNVSPDAVLEVVPSYDVELSNFRDWQEVGAWYSALEGDRASAGRTIRRKAEKLIAGLDDDRAKIEAIYTYVSTELRYLALVFGAGRYQPHPAAEVLKNGYGDCKDKHTLLAALLGTAGFQSSPVLIGSLGEPTEEVPSPQSFDHVITAVSLGDDLLWLDSSQSQPFSYLDPALRGKEALLIHHSGEARLVTVPDYLPFPTNRAFSLEGEIDEAGHLKGEVQHLFRGDVEAFLRAAFLNSPKSEWQDLVRAFNMGMGLAGEISDLEVTDPTAIEEPLKLSYTLQRTDVLNRFRENQTIALVRPPFEFPEPPGVDAGEAPEPWELGELLTMTSRFELTLPAGFEVRAPVAVAIDHDFASYDSSYAVDGRRLVAEQEIVLKQHQLAHPRFGQWAALRKTAQADGKQSFSLRRSQQSGLVAAEVTDAGSLFEAARSAARAEDYKTAVSLLSRVVELEPEHATAWYRLGRALVKSGEAEKGADALRRQIEVDPFHEQVHSNLGWALEKVGDLAGAEAAYRAQLERYPLNRYANAQLGELLHEQERWGEAVPYLESALSIKSDDHESRMLLGRCYLRLGRQEEGVATLEPLARLTDPDALYRLGKSAARSDDSETAVTLFSRVVELEPEHATAWYRLGRALVDSGEAAKGADALRRQLEINPLHKHAHNYLGWALEEVGDPVGAEAAYRAQLERYPLNHYANAQLGEFLYQQKRCDEAAPYLASALSIDAGDHKSRMRLGHCYLRLGRREEGVATLEPLAESSEVWPLHAAGYEAIEHQAYETAILLLRRVIELEPNHEHAFNNLGRALRQQGRLDEAVAALRRQIEIEPNDQWAHKNLGWALFDQGRHPKAIAAFRRHIEIVPKDTGALHGLGMTLWRSGTLADAVEAFGRIVEIDPAYPDIHSMLGVALFESNRFEDAAEALEKALAINARDFAANRTLGVILARKERYAEALPLLEKALAIAPERFQDEDILEYVRKNVGGGG